MAFLFRSRPRIQTPTDSAKSCRDYVVKLDQPSERKKAAEEISKCLHNMKLVYFGDGDNDPVPDQVNQLVNQIYASNLLPLFANNLHRLEFEAKKDVVAIFNGLLRRQVGSRWPTVDHLSQHEETILALNQGYNYPEIALHCGQMLRECFKYEQLAKVIITPSGKARKVEFWQYFEYIENSTFDIASDAFSSFRDILTRHKPLTAGFLEQNYDLFFEKYTGLLTSSNYVWKRQSLKLLGEILLDRANFNIMNNYIQSTSNLKMMMNFLRDRSAHIQFEAFHVFKVFVANPNKTPGVKDILMKNKEKLLIFLQDFHKDRKDEQFMDEKSFLIQQIHGL